MTIIKHPHTTIESTQDWAKDHAHSFDLNHFHIITAQEQTKGRGRFKRIWFSPKNVNIYATYCFLMPQIDFPLSPMSLVTSLSIAEVLQKLGVRSKMKWPNDIFINDKKVGGVLVETQSVDRDTLCFVGIGLNVNMESDLLKSVDKPATSLLVETQKTQGTSLLLDQISTIFIRNLEIFKEKGFENFHHDFQDLSYLTGKKVTLQAGEQTIQGLCKGVDVQGALLLEEEGETKPYVSGEIISWESP